MKLFAINKVQLSIISVMIIVAIDMFGITFVIPVFATFSRELGAPMSLLGVLYTVYSAGAFLSSLVFGIISDKIGRRNTFLAAGSGVFAAFVGSGTAKTFTELVIWRGIAGLFTGTTGCAYAYIADVTQPVDRPKYYSYLTAMMSTCFVVGPLIGGGFAIFGIRVPFYAAAACAGPGLITTFFFIHNPEDILSSMKKYENFTYQSLSKSGDEALTKDDTEAAKTDAIELVEQKHEEGKKAPDAAPAVIVEGVSPWFNPLAMIVGGFGTFCNGITFTGLAVLVPLLLMSPSFGIVAEPGSITPAEAQKVSLTIGYILGLFGIVQALGMIFLFPRVNKQIGLIGCAAVGGGIFGTAFLCFVVCDTIGKLIPIYIAMAIGNSLTRPAFPAYLGFIAPKGRNAAYVSINVTFTNLAMMIGAQMTLLYAPYPRGAFALAGLFSVLNCIILSCVFFYDQYTKPAEALPVKEKSDLEKFFGEGKSETIFWDEIHKDLEKHLKENNYARALQTSKGQQVIKELLLKGLPHLPNEFEERMEAVYNIYLSNGHEQWAYELAGYVPALHKHVHSELGVPGAT